MLCVTKHATSPNPPCAAADSLLRAGERPTIEKVRAKIGRGSPNTINPLLDAWWQRLAGRLDAGPAAAAEVQPAGLRSSARPIRANRSGSHLAPAWHGSPP